MDKLIISEQMVAMILLELSPNGVIQVNISAELFPINGKTNEQVFYSAVRWLRNEGLLNYESSYLMKNFSGVALTGKGYQAVNKKFFNNNEDTTLDVAKKVSEGSPNYSNAGDFLGGLLGGFTKSIGS